MFQSKVKQTVCAGVVAAISLLAVDLQAGSSRDRGKSQDRGNERSQAVRSSHSNGKAVGHQRQVPASRQATAPRPTFTPRQMPASKPSKPHLSPAPRQAPVSPPMMRRPTPPSPSSTRDHDDKHKHFGLGISDHGLSLRIGEHSRDKGFSIGLNLGGHSHATPVRAVCGHGSCHGVSVCRQTTVHRPTSVVHTRHACGHASCFGLSYCRTVRPIPAASCSIRYYPGSTTRYCSFHHSGYHADCHLHFVSPVITRTVVVSEPAPVFEQHVGLWMLLIDQPHEAALAFSKRLDRCEDDAMARLGHAVAQARIGDDAVAIWSLRDAMRRDATVLGRVPNSAELRQLFLQLAERFRMEARAGDRSADRWFMISALYTMRGEWSAAEVALENARYHGDSSPSERSLGLFIDGRFEATAR